MKLTKGSLAHDVLGVWALVWCYGPMLAALVLFGATRSGWAGVLAFFIVGARQHALTILAHESWHYLLFRKRSWNIFAGKYLISYPLLSRFEAQRLKHFEHHRKVGTLEDPDRYYWGWEQNERGAFVAHFFGVATGLGQVLHISRALLRIKPPLRPAGARPATLVMPSPPEGRGELYGVIVVQLIIWALFAVTLGWFYFILLWLLPFMTLAALIGELRQFLEHRYGVLMIFRAGPFERFVFGAFNFNLHGFHHVLPAEPWFTLPRHEAAVREAEPSLLEYPSYLRELASYLFTTQTPPAVQTRKRNAEP